MHITLPWHALLVPAPPAHPVAVPLAPTPPAVPAPTPTTAPPQAASSGPNGYPENTPVVDMSAEQQAAYWKHHARQHEARWKAMGDYDDLKAKAARLAEVESANMTDHQRAIAEAEQRGRTAAPATPLEDGFGRNALDRATVPDHAHQCGADASVGFGSNVTVPSPPADAV